MRRLSPRPLLLVVAALATSAGCDTASDPADDVTCASIGVAEAGTVVATTPAGGFETACVDVTSDGGLLVAIAREPGSGSLGGETIELYVSGTEPGTYVFGGDGATGASYGRSPETTAVAREGSVTVTSFAGGAEGTFSFVTTTGDEVAGGRFDLDF
ncbi:DUF6252 family protein [Rubrivirga sp. S365]|uniref:DUF6252 family protein n=1 Tax=Rubrivirga sp. S365 TaxID=3076080 RepID=UPI0028C8F8F1|nr:DUF6252 family protein [Rubrivirga sp. S365]MDT7858194.1 DUF6252 family protein [Rubrivirga sp. S365]